LNVIITKGHADGVVKFSGKKYLTKYLKINDVLGK